MSGLTRRRKYLPNNRRQLRGGNTAKPILYIPIFSKAAAIFGITTLIILKLSSGLLKVHIEQSQGLSRQTAPLYSKWQVLHWERETAGTPRPR